MDFDVVAESLDGDSVLFGEVKWASRPDLARWRAELRAEAATFLRGRRLVCALLVKEGGSVYHPPHAPPPPRLLGPRAAAIGCGHLL